MRGRWQACTEWGRGRFTERKKSAGVKQREIEGYRKTLQISDLRGKNVREKPSKDPHQRKVGIPRRKTGKTVVGRRGEGVQSDLRRQVPVSLFLNGTRKERTDQSSWNRGSKKRGGGGDVHDLQQDEGKQ